MATWKISVRCNSGALYVTSCVVYYDRGGEGKKKCPWVRFVERHKKSRRALPAPDTDSHVSLQISTSTEIYLIQGTNVLYGSSDTGLLLSLSLSGGDVALILVLEEFFLRCNCLRPMCFRKYTLRNLFWSSHYFNSQFDESLISFPTEKL